MCGYECCGLAEDEGKDGIGALADFLRFGAWASTSWRKLTLLLNSHQPTTNRDNGSSCTSNTTDRNMVRLYNLVSLRQYQLIYAQSAQNSVGIKTLLDVRGAARQCNA